MKEDFDRVDQALWDIARALGLVWATERALDGLLWLFNRISR